MPRDSGRLYFNPAPGAVGMADAVGGLCGSLGRQLRRLFGHIVQIIGVDKVEC